MEILDKAKYHSEGDFPEDLSLENSYVLGGFFLAWCALRDLISDETKRDFSTEIQGSVSRTATPCSLYQALGGVLTDQHLSPLGASFASGYFDFDRGAYLDDFVKRLASELPTAYHVRNTWDNFEALCPLIDARFSQWRSKQ